ncbi:hypothetical protein DFJ74DRAFT_654035 [Hyaloraphidium curvatum]|nr:hypothetical protein DFJ74DRAFT_654035 [Hyaloraphidium curvatum]
MSGDAQPDPSARLACTNNGCGKVFSELENNDTACEYHPQGPIFHEGAKGWSCCKKRVVGFEEFLAIPGCTVGRHKHVPGAPKPTAGDMGAAKPAMAAPKVTSTSQASDGGERVEVYSAGPEPAKPAPSSVDTPPPAPADAGPKEEDLNDPPDAEIPSGAKCKRRGCGKEYAGPESRAEECQFHPGVAIFHEGSKGYLCCTRRVLEFDQFLKLPGCKKGLHRFLDAATPEAAEVVAKQQVQVRHDFYQTQTTVIITFYAKNVDKEASKVTFQDQRLSVNLVFKDGKAFDFDTPLTQPIRPGESTFTVFGTKVEVILRKANGISWPSIEPNNKVTSWTTFGVAGRHGSIGSTEMVLGQDAPIDVARR